MEECKTNFFAWSLFYLNKTNWLETWALYLEESTKLSFQPYVDTFSEWQFWNKLATANFWNVKKL